MVDTFGEKGVDGKGLGILWAEKLEMTAKQ